MDSGAATKDKARRNPNTDNRSSVRGKLDEVDKAPHCVAEYETTAKTNTVTEESKGSHEGDQTLEMATTSKFAKVVRATIESELIAENRHRPQSNPLNHASPPRMQTTIWRTVSRTSPHFWQRSKARAHPTIPRHLAQDQYKAWSTLSHAFWKCNASQESSEPLSWSKMTNPQ